MAKNIGATISLKDGNFTSGIKKAVTGVQNLKTHTTNATGTLKKMSSQNKLTGDSLGSLAKKVTGVVAAYAGFSKAVDFTKQCISACDTQVKAEARLEQLMMNVKGTTLENVDAIKKYASELQGVTTVGDEATIQGASQLATFQLQSDTVKTLLPSLQDLAVSQYGVSVSGDQMQQMANLMGKVMTGNVGALTRYGVTLDATQKKILANGNESERAAMLVEVLGQNFGGLSEAMANTPEGKIIQVKNAWGDMQEVIGAKLYPVLTSTFGYVASVMPTVQNMVLSAIDAVSVPLVWIKDNVLPPLITIFQGVWNYGVSAFTNIKNAVVSNLDAFSGIFTILGILKNALVTAFEFCKPAINWIKDVGLPLIVSALAGVVQGATAVFQFFVNNWNLIAPIIAGIAGAIVVYKAAILAVNVVQNAWAIIQGICTAAQWALNVALTANPIGIIIVAIGALIAIGVALWMNWDSVCAWCKDAFQSVADFFVNIGSSIASFFSNLWSGICNVATSIWSNITGFLTNAWSSIYTGATSIFKKIGTAISNVWSGIVNAIKGAINKIISGINSMIRGAVSGVNALINGINKVTGAVGIPAIPTFTAPQIPLLAKGGVIQSVGSVIVGEKGPEMLTLPKGAKVTPLANKPAQKSENNFVINIFADGKSIDEIIDELMPKLKFALSNL